MAGRVSAGCIAKTNGVTETELKGDHPPRPLCWLAATYVSDHDRQRGLRRLSPTRLISSAVAAARRARAGQELVPKTDPGPARVGVVGPF